MNTEPKKNPPAAENKIVAFLRSAPSLIWKKLSNNWSWKLLSVLLAICLWAGLIMQDPTLTRERRFTDVGITITGEDTLRRNGMIVFSGLEEEVLKLESFRAQVPQRSFDSVTAANYNPRIDLSRISEVGEQEVKVLFTTSSTYGVIEDAAPDTFRIVVDEYVTNYRIPVTLNITGEYPEGFYASTPIVEPSTIAVSGPRTLVDQVAGVRADMDLSSLSGRAGTTRRALRLYFVDENGERIESKLLEASSANTVLRTVTMEQRLYENKTLDISASALTEGEPAVGYMITGITATPSTLVAAGTPASLEFVEQLFVESPVNVAGAKETFTTEVRLRKPSELVYLSTSTITVCVEIEPIIITRNFENVRLQLEHLPSDLRATLSQKNLNVSVTGPMEQVKALRASQVRAYIDAAGLEAGEHQLAVLTGVDSDNVHLFTTSADPVSITLTLQ